MTTLNANGIRKIYSRKFNDLVKAANKKLESGGHLNWDEVARLAAISPEISGVFDQASAGLRITILQARQAVAHMRDTTLPLPATFRSLQLQENNPSDVQSLLAVLKNEAAPLQEDMAGVSLGELKPLKWVREAVAACNTKANSLLDLPAMENKGRHPVLKP